MKIIYKNIFGENINLNQIKEIDEYNKVFIENDQIKKIEKYENNILESIDYFINDGEKESLIVQELSKLVNCGVNIKDPKDPIGQYLLENERGYRAGVLALKNRNLYDQFGNIICLEMINIINDQPFYSSSVKYFYGSKVEENKEPIFEATYKEDSSLEYIDIVYMDDPQGCEMFTLDDFNELEQRFNGTDLSYYLTAILEP